MTNSNVQSTARSVGTRRALIETAEALFGERGVDAVSLRQIGAATGSGNTAVVLYHFGDKEGLIESILRHRLPEFERRRAELSAAFGEGSPSIEALLRALWLPLFEQRDRDDKHSYAAFLASLGRSRWAWVWNAGRNEFPVTLRLAEAIRLAMPVAARKRFMDRAVAMTAIMTTALTQTDQRDSSERIASFNDAIAMCAAAFLAPAPCENIITETKL